jgi:hypothetical protein
MAFQYRATSGTLNVKIRRLMFNTAADHMISLSSNGNCGKRVNFCSDVDIGICVMGSRALEVATRLPCPPDPPEPWGNAD